MAPIALPQNNECLRGKSLLQLGQALQERGYRFTTVTPATHLRVNSRRKNRLASDLAGVFGWSRPFKAEVLDEGLLAMLEDSGAVIRDDEGYLRSAIRWSSLGKQLYLHTAFPTQAEDSVFFGPDTYRFVSAIERLLAEPHTRPIHRVADIGCGAAPAAIQIALNCPGAEVFALDVNPLALAYAEVNAALARLGNLRIRHSDLLQQVDGEFDLIVANPPYMLDGEARTYRHGAGKQGEGLSVKILHEALPRLALGGRLLLYTGSAISEGHDAFLSAATQRLAATEFHWSYQELDPDVFGEELDEPAYGDIDRIAAVVLKVQRTL